MLTLCPEDPLLTLLRDAFPDAHVLSRPQRRLRPLTTLAAQPGNLVRRPHIRPLGDLNPLLRAPVELPRRRSDPSPNFSGRRTRSVDAKLGLRLLTGFLESLGVDPELVTGAFQGAEGLSFSFADVRHYHVDVNALGKALRGAALDPSSPSARPLLDGEEGLYIVDSTLTSSAFTVQVTSGLDAGVSIQLPTQSALAQAGAALRYVSDDKRTLSFSGEVGLTFAFTALGVTLGSGGRIDSIRGDNEALSFSDPEEIEHALLWPTEQALAFEELPEDA